MCKVSTRGDQKVRGKYLPFLHRLINRAGITAHNTATHRQLMGYNMLGFSRLRALWLSSRQRYIARIGPFYVAFYRFTTQPITVPDLRGGPGGHVPPPEETMSAIKKDVFHTLDDIASVYGNA